MKISQVGLKAISEHGPAQGKLIWVDRDSDSFDTIVKESDRTDLNG